MAILFITWSIFDHSILTPTYSTFSERFGRLAIAGLSLAFTCLPGGLTSIETAVSFLPPGKLRLSFEIISQLKVVSYFVRILQLRCSCVSPSGEKHVRSSSLSRESAMRAGEPSGFATAINLLLSLFAATMDPELSMSNMGWCAMSISCWHLAMISPREGSCCASSPIMSDAKQTSEVMCSEESPPVTLSAI